MPIRNNHDDADGLKRIQAKTSARFVNSFVVRLSLHIRMHIMCLCLVLHAKLFYVYCFKYVCAPVERARTFAHKDIVTFSFVHIYHECNFKQISQQYEKIIKKAATNNTESVFDEKRTANTMQRSVRLVLNGILIQYFASAWR